MIQVKSNIEQVYSNLSNLDKTMSSRDASISREKVHKSINNIIAKSSLQRSGFTLELDDNKFGSQSNNQKQVDNESSHIYNEYTGDASGTTLLKSQMQLINKSSIGEMPGTQSQPFFELRAKCESVSLTSDLYKSVKVISGFEECKEEKEVQEVKGDRLRSIIRAFKDIPDSRKVIEQNSKANVLSNYNLISRNTRNTLASGRNIQAMLKAPDKTKKLQVIKFADNLYNENDSGFDKNSTVKLHGHITSSGFKKHSDGNLEVDVKRLRIKLVDDEGKKANTFTSQERNIKRDSNLVKYMGSRADTRKLADKYIYKNNKGSVLERYSRKVTLGSCKEQDDERSLNGKSGFRVTLLKDKSFKKLFVK